MLQKVRNVIIGSGLAGTVISRKMITAIGTGVIKINELRILKEFGGSLELTESWARNVLNNMNWVKRKETTWKTEPCTTCLEKETCHLLREKCPNGVFSGLYFPAFELNMERYFVSLRIQSEYRKIRTRKNSVFEHFSRSDLYTLL